MNRTRLIVAVGVLVVALSGGAAYFGAQRSGLTRAGFRRRPWGAR